ncbi:MAG: PBP1A family penicillin-binding protein [Dissulfurispiraceae bacterium]|jgi:penicillin-binding protein 1A|nr:PBP1A family penicillin-binding protein [Dissulfurispiraceae bacterium]
MKKWPLIVFISIAAIIVGAFAGFIYWNFSDLPEIRQLESYAPLETSVVYSSDGKVLAEFYMERRTFVPHFNIPARVKNAFIGIEDERFYSHPGIDMIGIIRALAKDLIAGGIVEGGSTITQQLAKMLFLKPERTVARKFKEAVLSAQIERRYTKDEIIGMYLNQAYFGTRAYGIEAAAQTYFNKSVSSISIAEAALLAGLTKAPSVYSPFKNQEKALSRRLLVLKKMLANKFITTEEYEKARLEPLPVTPYFRKYEAPYFVEYLRQQLESRYGDKIYTSGLRIVSTIDYNMQKAAEDAVQKGIAAVEKRVRPPVQSALVALDLHTGQIKALVGGTDFWATQFNRATMALRQPGSSFKPIVYAAALQDGYSVEDTIADGQIILPGSRPGAKWSPKNYDGKFHGVVTLKRALALSLNTATVRLAHQVGVDRIIATARRTGIKSVLQPYLPIALGASDVTLMELTASYGSFAVGKRIDPLAYERVHNRDGLLIEEIHPYQTEIFDPEIVQGMRDLLAEVVNAGTAMQARSLKRPVYGKTGTTNEFSDAWFIGFDDRIVAGVWVGRDNHKPIGNKEAGARTALPIWIDFMKNLQ